LNLAVTSRKKVSEFKIVLDQVSFPDKINLHKISLHKQSSDILYAELLQLVVSHSKALEKIDKMELRIKQEQSVPSPPLQFGLRKALERQKKKW